MKSVKIYAEALEKEALAQFEKAMSLPCNVQGALMPDAHTGYTLPIGAVIKSEGIVFPSYVGYDIGCGMCALKLDMTKDDLHAEELKAKILEAIPLGIEKHSTKQSYTPLPCTLVAQAFYEEAGQYQLGTLGGGNHFIELGTGKDAKVWIVIHSGSRGFGKKIAEHYMYEAAMNSVDQKEFEKEFEEANILFKVRNLEKFELAKRNYVIRKIQAASKAALESHVGFEIHTPQGKAYLLDMECALAFALANRKAMVQAIVRLMGHPKELLFINRNHNHAELKEGYVIHRKGATHAEKDMLGVIPGNMRDGSFIVRGKGNHEALFSSSHGAGRVLSRNKALSGLDLGEFYTDMQGIVTNHTSKTLDESPRAYKDIFEVMKLQENLVEVIDHIKPFLNLKG